MKEEKNLIKYEGNIFNRIINFFRGLFSKKKEEVQPVEAEVQPEVKINNELDKYVVNTDSTGVAQELRMKTIFQKYLDGTLDENDLTLQEAFKLQDMINKIVTN